MIVWDGGNNDFPFFRPDLSRWSTRSGPGTSSPITLARRTSAGRRRDQQGRQCRHSIERVLAADIEAVNPHATVVRRVAGHARRGPSLAGAAVLVIEDGPTVTHGGMPFGAGTVAAQRAGVGMQIDPRPYAEGSIAEVYRDNPTSATSCPRWATRTAPRARGHDQPRRL